MVTLNKKGSSGMGKVGSKKEMETKEQWRMNEKKGEKKKKTLPIK